MGFFDIFKKNKTLTNLGIKISSGRAVCSICNKRLNGKVYEIPDDPRYFCKKHSIMVIKNPHRVYIIKVPIDRKYNGYCEFCKKKEGDFRKIFYCHYCRKYHCENHRLPEKHKCLGSPKNLSAEYIERYSRGKSTITTK